MRRGLDLPVGGWLALGLGAAAVLLAGVCALALAGLSGIDRELARQAAVVRPRADAAADLQLAVLRLGITARAQALAPSPERAEALYAAEGAVESAVAELERLRKDVDGAELYAPVPGLVAAYRARAHALAVASAAERSDAETRLRDTRERLVPLLDRYVDLQQAKLDASSAAVIRRRERANALLVTGVAAALAILAAIGALLARAVRRPALDLVALTRRVATGDFAAAAALPAPGPSRARNELAELGAAFGAMARSVRDREERIAAQSEELQSQNEELQAQNEELHAQAEEIQSQQEELHAQNEQLRGTEEALREADRRKDEFLAVLSHELRNPLAPIVNALAILARVPAGSEQAARARDVASRQVRQLVRLVDDLLDVTRLARGKAALRRVESDVGEVVRHATEDHRALLEGTGVRLELVVPAAPVTALVDPERISQVVANLVQNAAKFTPRGGTIRVECAVEDARARLRVRDDGEGISPELLSRLFVPFVQADGSLARTRGGLGLGLALVKGIVELHGGTVRAESDGPGKGAQFTIELPLEPAARRVEPAAAPGRREPGAGAPPAAS